MCGTLGIIGGISLGNAINALQLLSHRGQDASGLAWRNNETGEYIIKKARGLPKEIPIENPEYRPLFLIGSTRYPTFGSRGKNTTLEKFAQPFESKKGVPVVISHNGNITNIPMLVDTQYESDAEFIADYLGYLLKKHDKNLERAVLEFMETIDGSYAISGIFEKKLFTFRDPYGIRPLAFGYNDKLAVSSSESYVHEFLGINEWRDVKAGELITVQISETLINGKNIFEITSNQLVKKPKKAHCMFEWVYFANPCSKIEGLGVYQARLNLGRELAKQIIEKGAHYDYVVPVPDTSKVAATSLAEKLGIPFREAIIKNRLLLRTFIIPDSDERKNAAELKYHFVRDLIKDKKLLVVDDSIVRGLTSKKIIKKLKELGAKKVGIAVTCPPQKYPCYYGIDFPKETELIAHNKTIQQIKEELDADELYYQKLDDLRIALENKELCTACITGHYPTKHAEKIRLLITEKKIPVDSSHYEQASKQLGDTQKIMLI